MKKLRKYKCESCGMVFFTHSSKLLKQEEKGLTCPYCESELWNPLIIK
jgi:DNA-directed RNA polymerase subunit RPC12/RpoP